MANIFDDILEGRSNVSVTPIEPDAPEKKAPGPAAVALGESDQERPAIHTKSGQVLYDAAQARIAENPAGGRMAAMGEVIPPAPPEKAEKKHLPPAAERGFAGDAMSHAARGIVGVMETTAQAGKVLTGGRFGTKTAADYWGDLPEDVEFLRPDVSEATGKENIVKRGLGGAIESAPLSAAIAPAAMAGAAAGQALIPIPVVGAAIGGIVGGGLAMTGLFGFGTYGKQKDEATERITKARPDLNKNEVEQMAHSNALKHAVAEVGGESAGDLAAYMIFSRIPGGKALYKGGKEILKELVAPNAAKTIAKGFVKDVPFEVGSEVGTAAYQNKADRDAGIAQSSASEAMREAIIPALFLSTGMGVTIGGYSAVKRAEALEAINTGTKKSRERSLQKLAQDLYNETKNKEVAVKFVELGKKYIAKGQEIPIDLNVANLALTKGEVQIQATEKQNSEAKKRNVATVKLREENLKTEDLQQIRGSQELQEQYGVDKAGVDSLLAERAEDNIRAKEMLDAIPDQEAGPLTRAGKVDVNQKWAESVQELQAQRQEKDRQAFEEITLGESKKSESSEKGTPQEKEKEKQREATQEGVEAPAAGLTQDEIDQTDDIATLLTEEDIVDEKDRAARVKAAESYLDNPEVTDDQKKRFVNSGTLEILGLKKEDYLQPGQEPMQKEWNKQQIAARRRNQEANKPKEEAGPGKAEETLPREAGESKADYKARTERYLKKQKEEKGEKEEQQAGQEAQEAKEGGEKTAGVAVQEKDQVAGDSAAANLSTDTNSVVFDGVGKGIEGAIPDSYNFTVTLPDGTDPSFMTNDLEPETVQAALDKIIADYQQKEKPDSAKPAESVKESTKVTAARAEVEKKTAEYNKIKDSGSTIGMGDAYDAMTAAERSLESIATSEPVVVDNSDSVVDGQKIQDTPTEGQKEKGNYLKPSVKYDGLDVTIENAAGTERSGKDDGGREWTQKLENDYGYIKGTIGFDKDHVDVFYSGGYQGGAEKVYIVNQYKPDGTFDEHKVVIGAKSRRDALKTYKANYEAGWKGGKNVVEMSMEEFKIWVKSDAPKSGAAVAGKKAVKKSVAKKKVTKKKTSKKKVVKKKTPKKKAVKKKPAKKENLIPEDLRAAISTMQMGMQEGEVGKRFLKEDGSLHGTWDGVKSTNPTWMKENKTLQKVGKKRINRVIFLVENGKKLTNIQEDIWDEIQDEAEKLKGTDPGLVAGLEVDRIEKEHGIVVGSIDETLNVGSLNPGDKVVVLGNDGFPELLEHQGFTPEQNAILSGISIRELDPFDMLRVAGKKLSSKSGSGFGVVTGEDGRAYILEDLAASIYRAGQSLAEFTKVMKRRLGNAYAKAKAVVKDLYEFAKMKAADQTGALTFYHNLDKLQKQAVDNELKSMSDGARIKKNLKRLKGTAWEKAATDSLLTRAALKELLAGRTPKYVSSLGAPSMLKTANAIRENGEAAIWDVLISRSFLGRPSKPGLAISSSYANCSPSKDCASFCYAATGRNFPANQVKNELINWAVENNPVKAAGIAARQYKSLAEFEAGKALRVFERGDFSEGWIPFIAELNRRGIRTHIFSKRPELLRKVSDYNLRLLSIDSSNMEMAEQNPDLKIAFVFTGGKKDLDFIDKHGDQIGIILPVIEGRKLQSKEVVKTIPKGLPVCPIDSGVQSIKGGWKCTKCDTAAGCGCYKGVTTKSIQGIETPLYEQDLSGRIDELRKYQKELPDEHRQKFSEELDLLISQIQSGVDPGEAGVSQGEVFRADEILDLRQEAAEKGIKYSKTKGVSGEVREPTGADSRQLGLPFEAGTVQPRKPLPTTLLKAGEEKAKNYGITDWQSALDRFGKPSGPPRKVVVIQDIGGGFTLWEHSKMGTRRTPIEKLKRAESSQLKGKEKFFAAKVSILLRRGASTDEAVSLAYRDVVAGPYNAKPVMFSRIQKVGKADKTDAMWDLIEAGQELDEDYLSSLGKYRPWKATTKEDFQDVWRDFITHGVVRNRAKLDRIASQVVDNILRLDFNTRLAGHTEMDPQEMLDQAGIKYDAEFDPKNKITKTISDKLGRWLVSDNALAPLMKHASDIISAETSEERLKIVDRVLNEAHQRFDLAELFIEGGTESLDEMAGLNENDIRYSKSGRDYKKWGRGYKELSGLEISDAKPGQGYIFKVYHGTTNVFDTFDPTIKGNTEGAFGAVNYFTSDQGDANMNYAGMGADLTQRVTELQEKLEQEIYENYDLEDTDSFQEMTEDYDIELDSSVSWEPREVAVELAEKQLVGDTSEVMDVLVRLDNPAFVGGKTKTWIETDVTEQYREDAQEEIWYQNDATKEEKEDGTHDEEIQQYMYEMSMYDESPVKAAIEKAINSYETDANAADVYAKLELYEGEVSADALYNGLRQDETLMQSRDYDTDTYIGSHIVGEIFKNLGFDGIVLQNAEQQFRQMGLGTDTSHVHVFADTPGQIKSADKNSGAYDERTGNIYKSKGLEKGKQADTTGELESKLGKEGLATLLKKGLVKIINSAQMDNILAKVMGPKFSLSLLHGSGTSGIEKFNLALAGSNDGTAYGHGIYLTDSKAVAKYYAENESGKVDGSGASPKRKTGQRNIYKADVAGEHDFVNWENITQAQKDKLMAEAKKNHPELAETLGFFLDTYEDGGNAYRNISYVLGGDTAASQFFLDAGIDGITYSVATMTGGNQKGTNYVIFDQNAISITDSIRYSQDGEIEGFTMPDGTVYLVDGNIRKGQAMSVLVHELGVHAKELGFNTTKQFHNILNMLDKRAQGSSNESKAIRDAQERIPEDTGLNEGEVYEDLSPARKAQVDIVRKEETLAYLITNSPEIGVVRRFYAALKKFLVEKMGVSPKVLSNIDLQALALSVVKREAGNSTVKDSLSVVGEFAQPVTMSVSQAAGKIKGMANFKKWFKGSKVVDKDGKPLVVYHGTNDNFTVFNPTQQQTINGNSLFFSDNKETADSYSLKSTDKTMPVYLSAKNQFVMDAKGLNWDRLIPPAEIGDQFGDRLTTNDIAVWAEREGYDGLLIKNVIDRATGKFEKSNTYVVFDPSQVKSIYNPGLWGKNQDIMESSLGPKWHSRLENTIKEKGPKQATGKQWLISLGQWKKKGAIPPAVQEELEWSGLEEMLQGSEGKVSKQDVLVFLKEYGVKVEDVVVGERGESSGFAGIQTAADGEQYFLDAYGDKFIIKENEHGNITTYTKDENGKLKVEEEYLSLEDFNFSQGEAWDYMQTEDPWGIDSLSNWGSEPVKKGSMEYDFLLEGSAENNPDPVKHWYPLNTDDPVSAIEHKDGTVELMEDGVSGGSYPSMLELIGHTGIGRADDSTNFDRWQLPGGKNYKELYVTLPMLKEKEFRVPSLHESGSEKANTQQVIRVRFNARRDNDGNNVLFIEEIQSDLHQQGRKIGYNVAPKTTKIVVKDIEGLLIDHSDVFGIWDIAYPTGQNTQRTVGSVTRDANGKFNATMHLGPGRSANLGDFSTPEKAINKIKNTEVYRYETAGDANNGPMEAMFLTSNPVIINVETGAGDKTYNIEGMRENDQADFKKAAEKITNMDYEAGDWNDKTFGRLLPQAVELGFSSDAVPDAPFKSTHNLLGIKRIIRYAVEEGFDKVAWISGHQTADRYDLSKQVDTLQVSRDGKKYTVRAGKEGEVLLNETVDEKGMADLIGKDLAEKAVKDLTSDSDFAKKEYSGPDLKLGGKWATNLYDKSLPKQIGRFIKKYGSKVKVLDIGEKAHKEVKVEKTPEGKFLVMVKNDQGTWGAAESHWMEDLAEERAEVYRKTDKGEIGKQLGFDITPKMKAQALGKGMPMFSRRKEDRTVRGTTDLNAEKDGKTSKSSVLHGDAIIRGIMEQLAAASSPAVAKIFKGDEVTRAIENYNKAVEAASNSRLSAAQKQKFAADFANKLPYRPRAKLLKILARIAKTRNNTAQQNRLDQFLQRADKALADYLRQELVTKIRGKVKPLEMKKGDVAKGRGALFEEDLKYIRNIFNKMKKQGSVDAEFGRLDALKSKLEEKLEKAETQTQIDSLQEQLDKIEIKAGFLNAFGGIARKNVVELAAAKKHLDGFLKDGRVAWRDFLEENRQRNLRNQAMVAHEVSPKGKKDPETPTERSNRETEEKKSWKTKISETKNSIMNTIQSWELSLDKIIGDRSLGTLQSKTVDYFGSLVHYATRAYEKFEMDTEDGLMGKASEIWGVPTGWRLRQKFAKLDKVQEGKVFTYTNKKKEALDISPLQAAYWYQIWKGRSQSPAIKETFERMGVTPKTMQQIEKLMGKELTEWADYLVYDFYQEFHGGVNEIYKQVYGVDLQKTLNYVPLKRQITGQQEDKAMESMLAMSNTSTKKGGFHERVYTTKSFKMASINDVLLSHTADMNHFKAWALPSKEINGTFNSPHIRDLITRHHGQEALNQVKFFQKRFTMTMEEVMGGNVRWMDNLRSSVIKSMVGMNPVVYFKQLSSIPAFAADIPAAEWVKHTTSLLYNPVNILRAAKILGIKGDSIMMKSRYRKGHSRDIREAKQRSGSAALSGAKRVSDYTMGLTALGDKMAIIAGGWAVYKYHYGQHKKAGKSKQEAHKLALAKFEQAAERTQQSAQTKDMGTWQQGDSMKKLFTFFMTSPASYTRMIDTAVRNMSSDPANAAKRLFIFGVVMPVAFQAITDGFLAGLFDDDDDDRKMDLLMNQATAIARGPFNGLPFGRSVAEGVMNKLTGKGFFDTQYSPLAEVPKSLENLAGNTFNAVTGGTKRIPARDYKERALMDAFVLMGYWTGFPSKPAMRLATGWSDALGVDIPFHEAEKTKYPVKRAVGFSPYALGDK